MPRALLVGLALLHGYAAACTPPALPLPDTPQGRWATFQTQVKRTAVACPSPARPGTEHSCERIAAPLAKVAALLSAAQFWPSPAIRTGQGVSVKLFGPFDHGIWRGQQVNLFALGNQTLYEWTNLKLGSAAVRLLGPLGAEQQSHLRGQQKDRQPCRNVGLIRQQVAPIATCRIDAGTPFESPSVVFTVSGALDDSLVPGTVYRYAGWSTCGPMLYRSP